MIITKYTHDYVPYVQLDICFHLVYKEIGYLNYNEVQVPETFTFLRASQREKSVEKLWESLQHAPCIQSEKNIYNFYKQEIRERLEMKIGH